MTRILTENSSLNMPTPTLARRIASIVVGLLLGVTLSITSVHADDPAAGIVSEQPTPHAPVFSAMGKVKRSAKKVLSWHQLGLASWYGSQFQGKETANGERFNMHDLTCAHPFLPLGTWVKVTNLHTLKWIVVRVNDRGPVPETRIVDLSSEAAHMLGMRGVGVTRVRLDVIDPQQAAQAVRQEKLRMVHQVAANTVPLNPLN